MSADEQAVEAARRIVERHAILNWQRVDPASHLATARALLAATERLDRERDAALSEAQERIHVRRMDKHRPDSFYAGVVVAEGVVRDMRGEGEPSAMAIENSRLRERLAAVEALCDEKINADRAYAEFVGDEPMPELLLVSVSRVRAALSGGGS